MIDHKFSSERYNQSMVFDDVMDGLYKLFKQRSIRVFGIHAAGGVGDLQIKRGYFENSLDVYLPRDEYDLAHVDEMIDMIDQSFLSPNL